MSKLKINSVKETSNDVFQIQVTMTKEPDLNGELTPANLSLGVRGRRYTANFPVWKEYLEAYGIQDVLEQSVNDKGDDIFIIKDGSSVQLSDYSTRVKDVKRTDGTSFPEEWPEMSLYVVEQHEPHWDGQMPKINPSTNKILTRNGQEIYSACKIKFESQTELKDQLIAHDSSKSSQNLSAEELLDTMTDNTKLAG